jgi:hypothetical protein
MNTVKWKYLNIDSADAMNVRKYRSYQISQELHKNDGYNRFKNNYKSHKILKKYN